MRMRQFLIALAAAVLLAALATPAAGEKPSSDPSGTIEFLGFNAYPAGDYPNADEDDCLVSAGVSVASNVKSVLVHNLTAPGLVVPDPDPVRVDLKKTDDFGVGLQLLVPDVLVVPDVLDSTFSVSYWAEFSDGAGTLLYPASEYSWPEVEELTCPSGPLPPPPPTQLSYNITSMRKGWTATVWAFNFGNPDEALSMKGRFGENEPQDGFCELSPETDPAHWVCGESGEWTSPVFDKKTGSVFFDAFIGDELVCTIKVNRGGMDPVDPPLC